MTFYLDSVIVIYYLEYAGSLNARALNRLAALWVAGDGATISDLVRMECRVGPLRTGDSVKLRKYDAFFANPALRIAPLSPPVLDRAAEIRARHGFKTPDSIHLAAAFESGCDCFLTHDSRRSRYTGLVVEILP